MGNEVGDYFAIIENSEELKGKLEGGIKKELGNVDIYLWNEKENKWNFQNGLYETGPIAVNRQIIPLKNIGSASKIKVKLVLNKGLWRLDYLALTNIKAKVNPIEISPLSIFNKNEIDCKALNAIKNPDKYLISMPGSEYKFNFALPKGNEDYELFLYTKGYYLEWMREHWLKDKNLKKLRQIIEEPKKYLMAEAKDFKYYETMMEQEFWSSKIDTKKFAYNEH
jgi:hypothetical protein